MDREMALSRKLSALVLSPLLIPRRNGQVIGDFHIWRGDRLLMFETRRDYRPAIRLCLAHLDPLHHSFERLELTHQFEQFIDAGRGDEEVSVARHDESFFDGP